MHTGDRAIRAIHDPSSRYSLRVTTEAGPRAEDVDLGSLDFWGLTAEARGRSFAALRRDAPISRHQPLEDILGLTDDQRQDYWAIVRHADVRAISRDPATFWSGEGAKFGDAPQA